MSSSFYFCWTQFKNTVIYVYQCVVRGSRNFSSLKEMCLVWTLVPYLKKTSHHPHQGSSFPEAPENMGNRARPAKEIKVQHIPTHHHKGGASEKNTIDKGPALQNPFLRNCHHKISYVISCTPKRFIVQSQTHISSTVLLLFHNIKTKHQYHVFSTCFISPLIQGLWAGDKDKAKEERSLTSSLHAPARAHWRGIWT